ncbi:hypothetical protein PWEIH_14279 [Listeria weihenstephanensis FSL R9-0317]|uniref:DUF3006 domain-containing protein n=1 Tax=Listeria weihenstephanensis TaxID=1006155 RepID=A0A1S7FTI3_9LIST|nr:DUF3006 domain-containing protein [Listeria weihenstephanensis]AQY50669.1 hypothetical protein UE46_06245 [Listeria weihenstephanensis]EUJ36247.1 hypothetical protein PWEIH_14279 [Listeria weihenstephanensis FSL R9-0317]MBC1499585.1 DUF3006 domain-containing protein [Listeria weihenstephanensis]
MKKAILDRVEDGKAVFLLEPDHKEWLLPQKQLPIHIHEGDSVLIEGTTITLDKQTTAENKARIQAKLEQLRRRSQS